MDFMAAEERKRNKANTCWCSLLSCLTARSGCCAGVTNEACLRYPLVTSTLQALGQRPLRGVLFRAPESVGAFRSFQLSSEANHPSLGSAAFLGFTDPASGTWAPSSLGQDCVACPKPESTWGSSSTRTHPAFQDKIHDPSCLYGQARTSLLLMYYFFSFSSS